VSGLAAIGSFLAVVGLYGLLSYLVRHGLRDIGVRMALGADRAGIVSHTLRQAAAPVGVGLAIGLLLAYAAARALASSLYGVVAGDALTYAAASAAISTAALVACVIPAARASRVDPADVLRHD
jgi:ABC-type antimicrobial peptide transport system permease subunit